MGDKTMKLARIIGFSSSALAWLALAQTALAQSATDSASKGGTSEALPNAGSTELTYLIFFVGVILFVFGTMKLVLSFRD